MLSSGSHQVAGEIRGYLEGVAFQERPETWNSFCQVGVHDLASAYKLVHIWTSYKAGSTRKQCEYRESKVISEKVPNDSNS